MESQNFEKFIEKIAKISNVDKEEIKRRIEAKKETLSGLISFEGAAQIVAAELGVRFDNMKLNIADLLPGMRKVSVVAKILEIFGTRKYKRNDKELKVASMLIADETDNIRVVLWDTNHIALLEEGKIKKDDVIEISNAYVRGEMENRELHLTNISEIAISNIEIENVIEKEKYTFKTLDKASINARIKVRANVVQVFRPVVYEFCNVCNKKVDETCMHAEREKRAMLSFIVDDGTSTIRCLAFNENVKKLFLINDVDELTEQQLSNLLGEELWISGRVRKNNFRNALELVSDDLEKVNVKELIEQLQAID